jgi:hypothetical protein
VTEAAQAFPPVSAPLQARALHVGLEVLANFVLPFAIYGACEASLGPARALMAASAAPTGWALIELVRRRRIDALSILVLAGIGLSLLVFLGGGSVRFLQLREKLVTVLVGLVFLGSAAIGRPLIYQLGRAVVRRRDPSELKQFEAMKDDARFRRTMTVMTLVWGFGLVAEAAVSTALVFVLPVRAYLLAGPALGYGVMGAIGLWSVVYANHRRRQALALRAAA